MEWRFRISGAYLWGNHDAKEPQDTASVTPPPGYVWKPSTTINTSAAEQADMGLESVSSSERPRGHFLSHVGGLDIEKTSNAVVSAPPLADKQHGTHPDDEGGLQEIEGLSLRIASLLGEAKIKDARIKDLEYDLQARHREHLEDQNDDSLPDEAKDARLAGLESDLQSERSECSKAKEQVDLLLNNTRVKDARLEELQSNLDVKCGEYQEAKRQIASLVDKDKANGERIEQLESSLASERSERLTVQQLYTSLRQTIRVMVRIRPPFPDAKGACDAASWSIESGSGTLEIATSATQAKASKFRFDRVFRPQASNNDIFDEILPLVRQAATEGGHCVVMAHGASSTGKSFTMRGDDKASTPTPGIIQLAGGRFFDMVSAGATVEVSSMYAYNGQVWDLLVADKDRNLHIPTMQKACTPATRYEQVRSAREIVERLDFTMSKTVKAPTLLNAESSRGHYFFTIRVSGEPGDAGTGVLTFVDLAGNESVKESGVKGKQFSESKSINSDLFALSEMIRSLRRGTTADTKQSKLTQLLAGSMGLGTNATARSEILMLATVNLSGEHMQKSMRTLKFAETVCS